MIHDDVIKWKYFPRYWPFVRGIHRSPVNSPHKGPWRGALMFSLICAWIICWVNNREAGDLRRHCTHYVVIVMTSNFTHQIPKPINRQHIFIKTNALSYNKEWKINIGVKCIESKISNISGTKSPNLNDSRLDLWLSPPNIHWSQVLSREWRCSWSSAGRPCPNYIWVVSDFIAN